MSRHGKISKVAPKNKGYDGRITVRLPQSLKESVEVLAEIERRSTNEQIVVVLEQAIGSHADAIAEQRKRKGRK